MNAIHIALPHRRRERVHAGLVVHLKVGEKCCWRLTFGPRDLAKEQRKRWKHTSTTSSLVLPRAFSGLLHSSIWGCWLLLFWDSGMWVWRGRVPLFLPYPDLPEGAGISSSITVSGYPGKETVETRRTGKPSSGCALRCLRARLYTTVQRGVEDASSLQNAEAPTCGLALADSSLRVPERSSAGL